ncbi:MAG: hypothetical protein QM809_14685 [Gordonia sp. (in: high G+C Gram-positive bacteria)]
MRAIASLISTGALVPVIAGRYRLDDVAEVRAAHTRGEEGHVARKLVLQV